MSRCDFCSSTPVRWRYPCETFVAISTDGDTVIVGDHENLIGVSMEIPEGVSAHVMEGDWMACQVCHELIQDGNMAAVSERTALRFAAEYGPVVPDLSFLAIHQAFMKHRTGEPVPVGAE